MKAKELKGTLRCKAKKYAACMMATLMVVSVMDVGGWGMIEVKAEETGGRAVVTIKQSSQRVSYRMMELTITKLQYIKVKTGIMTVQ